MRDQHRIGLTRLAGQLKSHLKAALTLLAAVLAIPVVGQGHKVQFRAALHSEQGLRLIDDDGAGVVRQVRCDGLRGSANAQP